MLGFLQQLQTDVVGDQATQQQQPANAGVAAVAAVTSDNDVAVDEIAAIVQKFPRDRDAIFRWLHEHRGNQFAQAVVAKTQGNKADKAPDAPTHVEPAKQIEPAKAGKQAAPAVGDQYIDHGAVCGTGVGCFLQDGQRTRLINSYQARVMQAQESYRHALEQMHVDKLFEKLENDQKSNLPWMFSLVIDIIGAEALKALTKALNGLLQMEKENLLDVLDSAAAGSRTAKVSEVMWDGLHGISSGDVTWLSKKIADAATKKTQSFVKKATKDGTPTVQNAIDTDYIGFLMDNASSTFQALREQPPGLCNDAQLVMLWQGYDAKHHTVSAYKTELTDKLARFNHSGVMDIGRDFNARALREMTQINGENPSAFVDYADDESISVVRDRTLVKLEFLSGRAPQYANAHRDFQTAGIALHGEPNTRQKQEGVYDQLQGDHRAHKQDGEYVTPWRDAQLQQKDATGATKTIHVQREFHIERLIAPEFEDIAIERHNVQWKHPPRTIVVDDRLPRVQDGAPMQDYKPQGNYVVVPGPKYKPDDPTTWWGFAEHRPAGTKY